MTPGTAGRGRLPAVVMLPPDRAGPRAMLGSLSPKEAWLGMLAMLACASSPGRVYCRWLLVLRALWGVRPAGGAGGGCGGA